MRVDLLRVEADVVCQPEEVLHQRVGVVQPSGPRVRVDEPERASEEGAFLTVEPVAPAVAVHVRPLAQLTLDRVDRAADPLAERIVDA